MGSRYVVAGQFFRPVGSGNPSAVGTYFGVFGGSDHAVYQTVVDGFSYTVIYLYGFHFADVAADPVDLALFPVEHSEVEVVPRAAVDDRTVGGTSAGRDTCHIWGVAEIERRYGQYLRFSVNPSDGLVEVARLMAPADPDASVGRNALYLRNGRLSGGSLRSKGIPGDVESDASVRVGIIEKTVPSSDTAKGTSMQ